MKFNVFFGVIFFLAGCNSLFAMTLPDKKSLPAILVTNEFLKNELEQFGSFGLLEGIDICNTPTGNNLRNFYEGKNNIDKDHYQHYLKDPQLRYLLHQIIHKESEMQKYGYQTFIHGQKKIYYWPEKLFTILYGIKYKKDVTNFLCAHVRRNDLIQTVKNQFFGTLYAGKKYLFMNPAFFTGPTMTQDASYYIANNSNWKPIKLTPKASFDFLGYSSIYSQFHEEIQDIDSAYQALCNYGNALLIALPKDTNNPYLEKCSEEEYTLKMSTKNGGLDPATGIKIIPLITGDPEKIALLQKQEELLFAKIKAVIEQEEMCSKALNRAKLLIHHIAPN